MRWRRLAARAAVRPGDRVLDAACGTGDLAIADKKAGAARVTGLDFSREDARARAAEGASSSGCRATCSRCRSPTRRSTPRRSGFGVRNVADLELALRELRRVLRPGGRLAILEITQPRGPLKPFFSLWFDRIVPLLGKVLPGGAAYTYLPASVKRFPPAEGLVELLRAPGSATCEFRLLGGSIVALHTGSRRVTQLAQVHATPGLAGVHGGGRGGLAQAVAARPGLAQEVARRGARRRREAPSAAALLPDGARRAVGRRPRSRSSSCTWRRSCTTTSSTAHGFAVGYRQPGRCTAPTRRRPRATTSTRARSRCLLRRGDEAAVSTLADAALCLSRGEAMQKLQTHDPDTPVAAYLERCGLKTGKLIEAACLLGSGGDEQLGAYGLNLGIAFQIADDILDCAGETQQTGKIPGTDLREGTPTMPLLLAAAQNEVVRSALAGGPLDGALVAVATTDAIAALA